MGYSYSGYGGGGDPTGGDSSNSAPLGSAAYFENQLKTMADLAAQKKAAYQKVLQQQQDMQNADNTNWWASGAQGASAGSSFGPWGTLIGGIIGSGLGQINAARTRHDKQGQGWMEAIGRTLLDAVPAQDTRQLNRTMAAAMPAAGAMGSAFQKYQANQKAANTSPTTTPSSDMLSGSSNPESLDAINARRAQMGLPPIGQDANKPYSV